MYKFDFVDSILLRKNIESIQYDVLRLGVLLDSSQEDAVKNCIRKTIVIYTASIIEALLLWKLNKEIAVGKVEIRDRWRLKDIGCSVPLKSKDGNDIAIAEKVREVHTIEEVDFKRRIDLSERHGIIAGALIEKLHEVRNVRNKLHIDGLEEVRKNYEREDVDFVFTVLEEAVKLIM